MRQQASKSVNGDVLEVAIGTGLQSEFYNAKNIKSFTGIDLSEGMLKAAKQKLSNTLSTVQSRQLEMMDAQELSFKDESFDTVIDTFSMCVIPNLILQSKKWLGCKIWWECYITEAEVITL